MRRRTWQWHGGQPNRPDRGVGAKASRNPLSVAGGRCPCVRWSESGLPDGSLDVDSGEDGNFSANHLHRQIKITESAPSFYDVTVRDNGRFSDP